MAKPDEPLPLVDLPTVLLIVGTVALLVVLWTFL